VITSSAIDLPDQKKIGLFWLNSLRSPAANQNTAHCLLPPDLVALDLAHCIFDYSGTSSFRKSRAASANHRTNFPKEYSALVIPTTRGNSRPAHDWMVITNLVFASTPAVFTRRTALSTRKPLNEPAPQHHIKTPLPPTDLLSPVILCAPLVALPIFLLRAQPRPRNRMRIREISPHLLCLTLASAACRLNPSENNATTVALLMRRTRIVATTAA